MNDSTTSGITIRQGLRDDMDNLADLLEILFSIEEDFVFDEFLQRQGLDLMLANPQGCILVAEVDGRVAGMCTGQLIVSTAEGGPALLVEDVIVHEKFRNRGVGSRLMEQIAAWARTKGVHRLQLLADRNNHTALEFYRKIGWQTTQLICLRKK